VVTDLPVALGDIEIQPRVRINQIDLRKLGLELHGLAQIVLSASVMSNCRLRPED
jgi:hypothetical protein